MSGCIRYHHPKTDRIPVVKMKLIDRHIGDLDVVHKDSVVTDHQSFQKTILIPVGEPPVRCKQSGHIGKITGTGPHADKRIVQIKMNIGGPDIIAAGSFGGELGRDGELVDLAAVGNDTGDQIFHIALGKPEDVSFKMLLVSKKSGVVHFTDDGRGGGKTAGGIDLIGGILACPKMRFEFIVRLQIVAQNEQDLVQVRLAHLLIAVDERIRIDPYQIAAFQLADMIGQGAVGNVQTLRQVIHAHLTVFQQEIQYGDPDLGSQRFEDFQFFLKILYVSHDTPFCCIDLVHFHDSLSLPSFSVKNNRNLCLSKIKMDYFTNS